jgi:hypothetical protein
MDRIDVLGDQYRGFTTLTKELLSETDDAELQEIVEKAVEELQSPIALVSLVLDQIQFFKAHVGLPDVLASARGTHRDASFCQFVVRDGQPFEVNDGASDARIPQHVVKEFDISAYLGMPIKVGDTVVGSLCVLDTEKRTFTEEERTRLEELSHLVTQRLTEITTNRRKVKLDLTYATLPPALTELSNALQPIQEHLDLLYTHVTSIRSFLHLYKYVFSDKTAYSDMARMSFEAAVKANEMIQDHSEEIEANIWDGLDCLQAINRLVTNVVRSKLSDIVAAAQDLARNDTKTVGGFTLPDFLSDPLVYTKADLAIALVSNCLLMLASELRKVEATEGIDLQVEEQEESAVLAFAAQELNSETLERVSTQLNLLIGKQYPTVSLAATDRTIELTFRTQVENDIAEA